MDEKWFQKRMLMAAEEEGCHAFKMTEMFASGRPDLYIKHPLLSQGVWVELKWSPMTKNGIRVLTTPLQRLFLKKEQEAGGKAMWVIGVPHDDAVSIYAGTDTKVGAIPIDNVVQSIQLRPSIGRINLVAILSVAFA